MEDVGSETAMGIDPAFDPALSARGERRRHLRSFAAWQQGRGEARFPTWDRSASAAFAPSDEFALFGCEDGVASLVEVGAGLKDLAWASMFLDRIADRVPAVRAHRAPLACEAEVIADGRESVLRGILLPFAGASGEVDFVQVIVSWKNVAAQDATIAAAVDSVEKLAPVEWQPRMPTSAEDRLAVARMWSAMALADPNSQPTSLHAALSALFDVELRDSSWGLAQRLVRDVFGEGYSDLDRRQFRRVLGHAERLGLAAGGLAALLASYNGGYEAMAKVETRLRRKTLPLTERASIQLRLVPVEAEASRNPSLREAVPEATPWTIGAVRAA